MPHFLTLVLLFLSLAAFAQTPTLKTTTEIVNVPVTAFTKTGEFITTLAATDLEVYENRVRQDIEFFQAVDAPLHIVFVLDFSASMADHIRTGKLRAALDEFTQQCHPEDVFSVIGFNEKPVWIRQQVSSNDLLNGLVLERNQKRTALFDALQTALEFPKLPLHKTHLVVLSDGMDNFSRVSFGKLRAQLRETDVGFDAIGFEPSFSLASLVSGLGRNGQGEADPFRLQIEVDRARQEMEQGKLNLQELSSQAGGIALLAPVNRVDLFTDGLRFISQRLRRSYTLAYYRNPEIKKAGTIKVQLTRDAQSRFPDLRLAFRTFVKYPSLK